ncbi:BTB/POZ domain-containing protein At5g66560-like [Telopea speciosissima]|uniref:BTB/POZ domain-containing protein At5g66560-like n=1 Tax=Telopea speciosissima TaxID=54955 RepID=UPI001CC5D923|nr:BTB/POZ domain-containing protein At5g66560-like [Telopea speciosissima]
MFVKEFWRNQGTLKNDFHTNQINVELFHGILLAFKKLRPNGKEQERTSGDRVGAARREMKGAGAVVSVSMMYGEGAMNLLGCWLDAMPVCHGARCWQEEVGATFTPTNRVGLPHPLPIHCAAITLRIVSFVRLKDLKITHLKHCSCRGADFGEEVLRNIKESIKTLKSCEALMPLADTLNIPQRCIDSIASRASSTDPSLFDWPMNEGITTAKASNQILWNGIDTGKRGKNQTKNTSANPWFEDLGVLSLPIYKRLISAMKNQDLSLGIIKSSLISYAKKSIPGLSLFNRKSTTTSIALETEQRLLLETIVVNLPLEKSSSFSSGGHL